MRTVLVSVSDKTGLENFLRRLERFDSMRLIGTSSTAKFLNDHNFSCMKVEELTKFPEILSGRVKTLHPKVMAGILSRPSKEDRDCLAEMEILEIDLVIVNLYPFEKKVLENLSEPEMVEHIDIGGVTLLRASAKNFERVAIVSDPNQYDKVIADLDANKGAFTNKLRKELALAAFQRTAAYDRSISTYMEKTLAGGENTATNLPDNIQCNLQKHQDLRYGENPHQAASWYEPWADRSAAFPPYAQLQGKEMSSNNIVDTYALCNILRELRTPAACIIKHNNPCGVACDNDIFQAFSKAYDCDPISAFGGIYGFTEKVNAKLATRIVENFVEIVAAPDFDAEALAIFEKKKNLRVLKLHADVLSKKYVQTTYIKDLRKFGLLIEKDMEAPIPADKFKCVTKTQLDSKDLKDVAFAWNVCKHLTSNAIFLAKDEHSLGIGVGQTNRVGSVKIAIGQAGAKAKGAILASDAFFPAIDNIEEAAKHGIKVIVQPGGSLKDQDVIDACDKAGIVMLFTGQRYFKH